MSDATPAHRAGFSAEQIAALAAPLDRANVKQREQSGQKLSYIEGWVVIAEANRIFGFDGWQRETVTLKCVSQLERPVGRQQRPGWGVTYSARVRITVTAGGLSPIIREGSGAGHGIDVDLGQAHESALKEAETDAMKRALMTFGNPFGLALYDKLQREVEGDAPPTPGSQRTSLQRTQQAGSSAPRQSAAAEGVPGGGAYRAWHCCHVPRIERRGVWRCCGLASEDSREADHGWRICRICRQVERRRGECCRRRHCRCCLNSQSSTPLQQITWQ